MNAKLRAVYDHVDDIDLFVGGMAEKHYGGGLLGETFQCLIGQQFKDLKYGDRFFYETKSQIEGFNEEQLSEIKSQFLSSVMCRNSAVPKLQKYLMKNGKAAVKLGSVDEVNYDNPILNCSSFKKINFKAFQVKNVKIPQ